MIEIITVWVVLGFTGMFLSILKLADNYLTGKEEVDLDSTSSTNTTTLVLKLVLCCVMMGPFSFLLLLNRKK
jgi:hypothetical protein